METTDLIQVDPATNTNKFWSATLDGCDYTVQFGRIGSTGQIKRKHLASASAARAMYDKTVQEKLSRGYVYANMPPGQTRALVIDQDEIARKLVGLAKSFEPRAVTEPEEEPTVRAISVPEVRPMLAEEVPADTLPQYIADDRWVIQQKLDGHRVCIHVIGNKLQVLGRAGQDSQHAPRFAQKSYADIDRLDDCVLDGELVEETFWIFDLPVHAGEGIDLTSPYGDRLDALERVFDKWAPDETKYRLLRTAHDAEEKGQLAIDCLKAGGEGVMVKDLAGTYQPGKRVKTVLKAKFVKELDCVITGIGHEGKENYVLGVYRDGALVDIGRCSAIGKAKCAVGDVATIRYLYLGADGRLYQPRFMVGPRTDKAAEECTYDQLAGASVNKEVLI